MKLSCPFKRLYRKVYSLKKGNKPFLETIMKLICLSSRNIMKRNGYYPLAEKQGG
jgi:hypothetical protein